MAGGPRQTCLFLYTPQTKRGFYLCKWLVGGNQNKKIWDV